MSNVIEFDDGVGISTPSMSPIGANSTSLSAEASSQSLNDAFSVSSVVVCPVFIVLLCYCMRSKIPDARYHRGAEIAARAEARRRRLEIEEAWTSRPELREAAIAKALEVQTVIATDPATGQLTLGSVEGVPEFTTAGPTTEIDDDDLAASSCVICLEPFRVGDVVAWNRNAMQEEDPCQHVFHKECVESWLINPKHDDCPSCRTVLITMPEVPETKEGEEPSANTEDSSSSNSNMPSTTSATCFVIMHGLISQARRRVNYTFLTQARSFETDEETYDQHSEIGASSVRLRRVSSFGGKEKKAVPGLPSMPAFKLRRVKTVGPGSPCKASLVGDSPLTQEQPAWAHRASISLRRTVSSLSRRSASFSEHSDEDVIMGLNHSQGVSWGDLETPEVPRRPMSWRELDEHLSDEDEIV